MSDCAKKPCGCQDQAIISAPLCEDPPVGLEPCSEVVLTSCVYSVFGSINMDIGGNDFNVPVGTNMNSFIQKLMAFHAAPTCDGLAAYGLYVYKITQDSIGVAFFAEDNAQDYDLQWDGGAAGSGNQNLLGADATAYTGAYLHSFLISGLQADTTYAIKTENLVGGCESAIINIKTNA